LSEDKSQTGKRLSRSRLKLGEEYRILGLLGTGGMAEVFKAEQTSLGRIVALKRLKSQLATNPEMLERFLREGKSAANLQHENIVQVYQMGELEGEHYIVMEYVEGRDLKSAVKAAGPLPWKIAALIIREIALGLSFAHQRGFIHRDIKPGNIMLSHKGEVKIMDFGIVRRLDSDLTQTGAFLGTPSYMSPEQLQGKNISPRSDLFSLGILFFEILTGDKPFRAENESSLVYKIMNEKEPPVRRLNPEVPRRVARVLKRLLKKDPAKRYESAAELAKVIEHMLGEDYVSMAGEEIAAYLAELEQRPDEDKTRKSSEIESEPAQVELKRKSVKAARTTLKKETGLKSRPKPKAEESETRWLVQTLVLMAMTLGLILLLYFLQAHGWLKPLALLSKILH
jgi:serine/threonine-protein kinase